MACQKRHNLLCILGHTAGGKTAFAASLAKHINGEIISADSRQVYRHMNIGTGKDLSDYVVGDKKIKYHLIDIVEPGYEYNVFEYQKDFLKVYKDIRQRNKIPVLCGGTGLYIEAVLKGYKLIQVPPNPEYRKYLSSYSDHDLVEKLKSYKKLHNTTDSENRKRLIRALEIEMYYSENPDLTSDYPELDYLLIGIKYDRESRRKRITGRLHQRLEAGMVEETEKLIKMGISEEKLVYYGLEYKYLAWYLNKKISYNEMVEKLNIAIHQFAKRQMTWFRKMERSGFNIHWLDGNLPIEQKIQQSLELIQNSEEKSE